jgi:transposase-like protein
MTDDRMAVLGRVEKAADADLVRETLACAAERIMGAGAGTLTGAAKGARSALREPHLNSLPRGLPGGYRDRDRDREMRAGRIALAILRLGKRSYLPSFPEPRGTAEKALAAVIEEA